MAAIAAESALPGDDGSRRSIGDEPGVPFIVNSRADARPVGAPLDDAAGVHPLGIDFVVLAKALLPGDDGSR